MKFRYIICLLIFVAFYHQGDAQIDTVRFTKIKLTNGASLRGYIFNDLKDENLIFRTPSGNSFRIALDDVKKMRFGRYGIVDLTENKYVPKPIKQAYDQRIGIYSIFGFGLNFAEYGAYTSFTSEVGKRFNKHFAAGLAINYDRDDMVSTLPVYINGRIYLNNRKVTPFVYAGAGYAFAWANYEDEYFDYNKVNGGLMGQAGVGYQINFTGSALLFNLGYKIQRIYQDYNTFSYYGMPWSRSSIPFTEPNINIKEVRLLRRAEFKISYLF